MYIVYYTCLYKQTGCLLVRTICVRMCVISALLRYFVCLLMTATGGRDTSLDEVFLVVLVKCGTMFFWFSTNSYNL